VSDAGKRQHARPSNSLTNEERRKVALRSLAAAVPSVLVGDDVRHVRLPPVDKPIDRNSIGDATQARDATRHSLRRATRALPRRCSRRLAGVSQGNYQTIGTDEQRQSRQRARLAMEMGSESTSLRERN
jgi:hypothetical protein